MSFSHSILANCLSGEVPLKGALLGFFTLGLVGSVTHCLPMCGGFIMAKISSPRHPLGSLLLPYHMGRISTYSLIAAVLAGVLNTAFLFLPVRGYIVAAMLSLAAVVFLVNAIPSMKFVFPWAARIRIPVPVDFVTSRLRMTSSLPLILREFSQGLLMGFIPCGLVMSALLASSISGSMVDAALKMAIFGLGTLPALFAVALGGQSFRLRFPATVKNLNLVFMIGSAVWLFVLAGLTLI